VSTSIEKVDTGSLMADIHGLSSARKYLSPPGPQSVQPRSSAAAA
jgi:hypothetical protein